MLAALARSIETGDRKPTDQARTVEEELAGRLDKIRTKYQKALDVDLTKFNAVMQQRGLQPVTATSVTAAK
jgi:hypothetical protein